MVDDRGRALSKAADPRDADDPEWNALWREICGVGSDPGLFPNKSQWEWTQGIYGLLRLGRIKEDAAALGVGAGHEPPLYWLANHTGQVLATDLYAGAYSSPDGRAASDDPAMLDHPERFAPYPFRRERLSVRRMDGRALDFPDNSFDIVFSFSAIEHAGGHGESAKIAREMARVAKSDGMVVISTEMIVGADLLRGWLPAQGCAARASWIRRLPLFPVNRIYFWPRHLRSVLLAPAGLELAGPLDTTVRPGDIEQAPVVGHPTGARTYCMRVGRVGKTTFTPVILFATKTPRPR